MILWTITSQTLLRSTVATFTKSDLFKRCRLLPGRFLSLWLPAVCMQEASMCAAAAAFCGMNFLSVCSSFVALPLSYLSRIRSSVSIDFLISSALPQHHNTQKQHCRHLVITGLRNITSNNGLLSVPTTKDKDHARDEEFHCHRPGHLEQFIAALRTATLSPLTFAQHLKAHLFGWSIGCLRIIYDMLYKSTHHHHHHHQIYSTNKLYIQNVQNQVT